MKTFAWKQLTSFLSFSYGILVIFLYGIIAIWRGSFFRPLTEREANEFLLARDRLWNLSKEWRGLTHRLVTLENRKVTFHYLSNDSPEILTYGRKDKPLVIFIHGFPDSWAVWRHILSSSTIQEESTVVAVDLPGYGGTDSLDDYSATSVLEALTEFIITVREHYGVDDSDSNKKVIIVGHDWGATIAGRLATEAPQLADRFILTNGVLAPLFEHNITLARESSVKMFKTFLREPWRSRGLLIKSLLTLRPVLRQLRLSGYIFAFQLPVPLVCYLGTGGNYAFLKAIHQLASGTTGEYTIRDAQDSMASTLGPGKEECKTMTANHKQYPLSVHKRSEVGNFWDITSYYRHGVARGTWHKSLETISALHSICPFELRRTSSGAGVFDPAPAALKANATIIWGKEDPALDSHLALEGIGDCLVSGSQLIVLPKTGHFSPIELESRFTLQLAVEWAIKGEKEDIGPLVTSVYPTARVEVQK